MQTQNLANIDKGQPVYAYLGGGFVGNSGLRSRLPKQNSNALPYDTHINNTVEN